MPTKLNALTATLFLISGVVFMAYTFFTSHSARDTIARATPAAGSVVRHDTVRCRRTNKHRVCSVPVIAQVYNWQGRVIVDSTRTEESAKEKLGDYPPGTRVSLYRIPRGGEAHYIGQYNMDELKRDAVGLDGSDLILALLLIGGGLLVLFVQPKQQRTGLNLDI